MDLSFSLHGAARRMAGTGRTNARATHARLIAGLAAAQAATPTARAAARLPAPRRIDSDPVDMLVALLATDRGWMSAPEALGGSFHPRAARLLGLEGT
ncbi:hypothetical protein SAMN06295912_109103 [Sphingomonas laterariae]|uniref:Uncharacterized protein n=2 Tax=Edaphosphingomonas laterariae TaxID=861865 RepID=A0A239FNT5_9SPHN|nr:hypothetical protein SAMN06295912_109103 [Sphingomonas laterariae]